MKNIFRKKTLSALLIVSTAALLAACSQTTPVAKSSTLTLQTSGLETLANGFHYEGWAIVDGAPVTTGKFNIDSDGNIVDLDGSAVSEFKVDSDISNASDIVLTIEPNGDTDTIPATTKVLGGALSNGSSSLTASHPAALGNDFSSAAGKFILATPTTATDDDEFSGVWFIDLSSGSPAAGLSLPTLPAGWEYEGWVVIDGAPVTTGRFTSATGADDAEPFSGPLGGPPFPGEDFVANDARFPTNLLGNPVVISIEPEADDSPAPFAFKPLAGPSPADGDHHVTYDLGQNLGSFPTATASVVYQ